MEARAIDADYDPLEYFFNCPEGVFCEVFNGEIVMLAAPLLGHQRICGELHRQLSTYLLGKRCSVFAGAAVQFRAAERRPTALIPDISVVCDPGKLKPHGIVGAPDMIIEILSPSNAHHDTFKKFNKYLREKVREYWIVDPERQTVSVHIYENGKYTTTPYDCDSQIPVSVLDDCVIDMTTVFPDAKRTREPDEDYE